MNNRAQYIASLDIEASYNLAKQMEAYRTNPCSRLPTGGLKGRV